MADDLLSAGEVQETETKKTKSVSDFLN